MNVFEELRREYESAGLDRQDLAADPMDQFDNWFQEAVKTCPGKWLEPNSMTLSTCADHLVTSRTVLLKEYENQQFVFFTNYSSEKGQQLLANPVASLLFYWPWLDRQIRINGTVEKTSREKSEKYFHSRSRGSQLGACISAQSSELSSRESMEQSRAELERELEGKPVPLPETWGGFALRPSRFEFWQGRLDRLHDRFQYHFEANDEGAWEQWPEWTISRLYP